MFSVNPIGFLFFVTTCIVVIGVGTGIYFIIIDCLASLATRIGRKERLAIIERKEGLAIEEGQRIKNVLRSGAVFVKSMKREHVNFVRTDELNNR